MLYELHAPIQYISEQLGHSSIKLTVDISRHPRQGRSTHLVDQLTQLSGTLAQLECRGVASYLFTSNIYGGIYESNSDPYVW
jgi:hypothetical protein